MRRFKIRWILLALVVILLLPAGGFVIWANTPLEPTAAALNALQSDAQVQVSTDNGWYVFRPASTEPMTGFIFYPGGRVDARAYALHVRDIAAQGYLAVIVPMPLNLAIFGLNEGQDVIAAFPQIRQWAIGGHSLGGAMAARFVQANPEPIRGLVFWASYPDVDLSDLDLIAASIYGTNDAVARSEGLTNARDLLPATTTWIAIEGGNHSQFGDYGLQPGDNLAGISADAQREQAVAATVAVLNQIESSVP